MIPALFFFKIPDLIGRKYCLLFLNVPQAAYWIITILSRDIYSLYIARFVGGLADALMYAALPIYLGEVTTPKIRGSWGNGQTFSFNAGFFLISAIGKFVLHIFWKSLWGHNNMMNIFLNLNNLYQN